MNCLSACHVLLYMILYQQTSVVYLQTLTLTIETSPLVRGADVRFKCLYSGSTCCTDDARVWTCDGTDVLNNGAPLDIAKYKEERNDASLHFDMKILNLDDSDFGKAYQCQYNFQSSNIVVLTKDITYESPPRTELCPFTYDSASPGIRITGTLNITKAAPSPVLTAYYGEDNLTPDLSITGVSNYDTWYYTLTVSTDTRIHCRGHLNDQFKLYAITGTGSTKICDIDMCECKRCIGICYGLSSVIHILGSGFLVIFIVLIGLGCLAYNEGCALVKVKWITFWHFIVWLILISCFALVVGIPICPCNESLYMLFLLMLPMLTGTASIMILHLFYVKFDHTCFFEEGWRKGAFVILSFVTGGVSLIAACATDKKWLKGTGTKDDPVKVYSKQGCKAVLEHTIKSAEEGWFKQIDNSWKEVALVGNKGYRVSAKPALCNKTHYTLCVLSVQPNDAGMYRCAENYYFELILLGKEKTPTPV